MIGRMHRNLLALLLGVSMSVSWGMAEERGVDQAKLARAKKTLTELVDLWRKEVAKAEKAGKSYDGFAYDEENVDKVEAFCKLGRPAALALKEVHASGKWSKGDLGAFFSLATLFLDGSDDRQSWEAIVDMMISVLEHKDPMVRTSVLRGLSFILGEGLAADLEGAPGLDLELSIDADEDEMPGPETAKQWRAWWPKNKDRIFAGRASRKAGAQDFQQRILDMDKEGPKTVKEAYAAWQEQCRQRFPQERATPGLLQELRHDENVLRAASNRFRSTDTSVGPKTFVITSVPRVLALAWSPDSTRVAVGTTEGGVYVWDTRTGRRLHLLRARPVKDYDNTNVGKVVWAKGGKVVAATFWDQRVLGWDSNTGQQLYREGGAKDLRSPCPIAVTAAGESLAACVRTSIFVRKADSGKLIKEFSVPTEKAEGFYDIDVSGKGDRIAYCLGSEGWGVLNAADGAQLYRGRRSVTRVGMSPDGRSVAAANAELALCIVWKEGKGVVARLRGEPHAVSWSPTGDRLAFCGTYLGIYDAKTWKRLVRMKACRYEYAVAWSPCGRYIAFDGNITDERTTGRLMVADAGTGKIMKTFQLGPEVVKAIAFSPDGKMLAVGGQNAGATWIWDTSDLAVAKKADD